MKKLVKSIIALGLILSAIWPTPMVAANEESQELSSSSTSELHLNWLLPSTDDSHLALNPINNSQQRIALRLDFLPGEEGTFAPGEIEIRLPRFLFQDRYGNNTGTVTMSIPSTPTGDTGYYFRFDGDYIIITNFRMISSDERLILDVGYNFTPSTIANNFSNEHIQGIVILGNGRTENSNILSLCLTTAVVPTAEARTEKRFQYMHRVWQDAWGPRPVNHANYFYIHYRLLRGVTLQTTQPFTLTTIEQPGNDGEIVAWATTTPLFWGETPALPSTWTLGNTAEFNASSAATWTVATPAVNGIAHELWSDIIVRYPRTGEPSQEVTNRATFIFEGRDDGLISEKEVTSTYIYIRGGGGGGAGNTIDKRAASGIGTARLTRLEMGNDQVLNGLITIPLGAGFSTTATSTITTDVNGFNLTQNGTQPFRTTVIDDFVYLHNEGGFHPLSGADYRFTQVRIMNYVELEPIMDSNNNLIGGNRVLNLQRSPIRIYYRVLGNPEWIYRATHSGITSVDGPWVSLSDVDAYQIKAVHDNGLYRVMFDLAFTMELRATQNVLDIIEDQPTVQLYNAAKMMIHDYQNNLTNEVTAEDYTEGFGEILRERDQQTYGYYLQRGTVSAVLTRATFTTSLQKAIMGSRTDVINQGEIIQYGVLARSSFQRSSNDGLTIEEMAEIINEQKEGVFYDLLPIGTTLIPGSITVRDARGRLADYSLFITENWRGSGRIMVEIHVSATYDQNFNVATAAAVNGAGTGFNIYFEVFYPWIDIGDFGPTLRNIVAYQSRSGEIRGPNVHPDDASGHLPFTPLERELMSNLASDIALDPDENNTLYGQITHQVSALIATNVGFSKAVRSGADLVYSPATSVLLGEGYSYRLRFQNGITQAENLVMFDVLEAAHSGNVHWRGVLQNIDISHAIARGIDPVVYYSTQAGIDPVNNVAHADLEDDHIWSTTAPGNKEDVTAIAIDLSRAVDGSSFRFGALESVVINLHMRTPLNQTPGIFAYNRAAYRVDIVLPGDVIARDLIESSMTEVELLDRNVVIAKTSDPASGTAANPAAIEEGVTYFVRIINEEDMGIRNVVVEDIIPLGLNFEPDELMGYFGDDRLTAIPLSEESRVGAPTITGNRVEWTIATLGAGESFTVIIPTTIDPDLAADTVFENTARIIGINDRLGFTLDSETTYHAIHFEWTQLTVNKVWEDQNNRFNTRPENIAVQLQANGENVGAATILSEDNNWSYNFTRLLAYDENGEAISYTAIEVKVPAGYEKSYSREGNVITITNTLIESQNQDNSRLPQTGASSTIIVMAGALAIASGLVITKKKKNS